VKFAKSLADFGEIWGVIFIAPTRRRDKY